MFDFVIQTFAILLHHAYVASLPAVYFQFLSILFTFGEKIKFIHVNPLLRTLFLSFTLQGKYPKTPSQSVSFKNCFQSNWIKIITKIKNANYYQNYCRNRMCFLLWLSPFIYSQHVTSLILPILPSPIRKVVWPTLLSYLDYYGIVLCTCWLIDN